MSWFDRLRNHSRDDELSRDIDREMAFHLAERADDLAASGMDPARARLEARRRFGNVGRQKEHARERDLFVWLDVTLADLRYAVRSLRSAPAFALIAILSLGLGIGANTAIFSILNAVMLKSLPVDHPEELVAVERDGSDEFTNPLWEAIRDRQDMFSGAFAFGDVAFGLGNGGEARTVQAAWVTGDFFSTLGVRPAVGRLIVRADDVRGCPGVVVLGHGFWQSEYGGAADVTGRTITFNGHPFTIVGVADPSFFGVSVGRRQQAYVPLCTRAIFDGPESLDARSNWYLNIMARPKPGMSLEQIRTRFATIGPAIAEATLPQNGAADVLEAYRKARFTVSPAPTGFSSLRTQYKTALYYLMAIVALVLLVACANVANLLLARAAVRRREVAVRLALGAGRGRIARQLITESLLLATLGAVAGWLFATWGSRLLVSLTSRRGEIALDLAPDTRMLAFTIGVAVLTGLVFGIAPAWQASHVDPQTAMKAQGRGASEGMARLRIGRALVVSQIAISLVLVAAAGLVVGSWRRLATLDPGFRRTQVLVVSADLRSAQFPQEQRNAAVQQMLARIRAIPGVHGAATAAITPISGSGWNTNIKVEGYVAASKRDAIPWVNAVSDRYFSTMGIPFVAGRDFDGRETGAQPPLAIVTESMARKFFGTPNALGRTFQIREGRSFGPAVTVIGVVGSSKYRSLRDSMPPIIYLPRGQASANDDYVNFEIFADAPLAVVPSVKEAIAETSPRITLAITTLERQLAESMPLMRATATLSGFFGALALVLATIGLYGMMSYSVARRRNEIGVRIALGAGSSRVVRMVLGDVGRMVVVGTVIGIALATVATRLVTSFIYDVKRNDPATLLASALLLAVVAALAAAIPAWRAARLDPVAALRED
jgi:predicted permease